MPEFIKIKNASEHNLKSVDLEIPHNSITVITGVSGSGKSSLAYDVIYKESQRRYLESFSAFSKQYIGKLSRPKVEKITGLKPALAIDQKTVTYNPRSTVGTMSQVYDLLRILFAKCGEVYCANCGEKVKGSTPEEIAEYVKEEYSKKDFKIFARLVEGHTGNYKAKIKDFISKGIKTFLIDGVEYKSTDLFEIEKNILHTIWAEVELKSFEINTILNAIKIGDGVILIKSGDTEERISVKHHCVKCNSAIPEIGSRLFSFNSKYGACETCNGLGLVEKIDPDKLIADKTKTLREGALIPTTPNGYIVYSQVTVDSLNQVCEANGFNVDTPWNELTIAQQNIIWYGSDKIQIPFGKHSLESRLKWSGITAKPRELGYYKGMLPIMEEILKRDRNTNILRFVSSVDCPDCYGSRLRKESRKVFIGKKNIVDVSEMTFDELFQFLLEIETDEISEQIVRKLIDRIKIIKDLGLGYLTASREATSLSGGEAQRIRLATQIGTELSGVLYILDEPSVGLHHKDNNKLIKLLQKLRDKGNTVVVVEHDEDMIRSADYVVDIGPKAGINGGEIIYSGDVNSLIDVDLHNKSITQLFLNGKENVLPAKKNRKANGSVKIIGAEQFNLSNINVEFKLGNLNVVTGVSGAGKSTLVHNILGRAIKQNLGIQTEKPGKHKTIEGIGLIKKIIEIDQSPIGKTPRSNPATYTKLFDLIRDLFASLPEAKDRRYEKGRFSFNNKGGRCEKCEGAGVIEIGMHFLANAEIECDECNGKRFNDETLEVKFKNKNIYEVLDLSIEEAADFFNDFPKIVNILDTMINLGIGYLKLGQPSTTLSGGEAQRIKLSSELYKNSKGKTLYILDEPTTGLHFDDIKVLLSSISGLVDKGNTVIVIEHNIDFIKAADWIVDLGPDSGNYGGELMYAGKLDGIKKINSYTAEAIFQKIKKENKKSTYISQAKDIQLRGANVNNLKNVDVKIPLNRMTVITGVSGSGKSSIAFDTLYSEARNRFTESFSPNARRMIGKIKDSRVEECYGITPAIAVNQKTSSYNPRSTVGTITDLYDEYRLLFSRIGRNPESSCNKIIPAAMFSFNNPNAACKKCKGMGVIVSALPELIVTNPEKSLLNGALDGSKTGKFYGDIYGQYVAILDKVGEENNYDFSKPYNQLTMDEIRIAMYGTGEIEYKVEWKFKRKDRTGVHQLTTNWIGFINLINDEFERKHGSKRGESLDQIVDEIECEECGGARLSFEVLKIKIANMNIAELSNKSIDESIYFFRNIKNEINDQDFFIAENLVKDILSKLNMISKLGLGYLSIDRKASTLSGGELQRIKLSNQLSAELSGVTYILDEPTIGLHPRDTNNLIQHLKEIQRNDNTLVIVEHDEDIIREADYIIDVGPKAGSFGGEIIAEGKRDEVLKNENSITSAALKEKFNFSRNRKSISKLKIKDASVNNLKNISLNISLNQLVAVTGVSGSGKTSLVFDVINKHENKIILPKDYDTIVSIDQSSIGTSPLSNILTYTGLFDKVRNIFANQNATKEKGFKKNHFSFNSKDGRCEDCSGQGMKKTGMDFLADIWSTCGTCNGKRYKDEILEIKYNGYDISEILKLTVSEAVKVFESDKILFNGLKLIEEIGLDYITLGQGTNTMSGGETQRLKLAKELLFQENKKTIYLFDEPTTGLHKYDVKKLLILFNKLIDDGHSVIVVEHNLDIIINSDWIIDLGPEAGELGGEVVFEGTPEEIVRCKNSYTGQALKDYN